jgi:hypothetical protein
MPISGPSSYVPTLNLFIPHWVDVNLILGAGGPLVLEDGTTIAILTGYRDQLDGFRASIEAKLNDVQIGSGDVLLKKTALLARIGEFNRKVRGTIGSSPYAAALPDVPGITAAQGNFLGPLDDMAALWAKINAATIPGFTGPLLLPGGYAVATFLTELAALKTAYATESAAEHEVGLERKLRDAIQVKASAALVLYRKAVAGAFAENDPHVLSLPAVTPQPGSTPDAVTANISWDATQLKAKITWSASTEANLFQYEIRFCPGPNYSTETEVVVGNILPTDPREFLTDAGLAASGNISSFKVYVITTLSNEKGSNTVTITRP